MNEFVPSPSAANLNLSLKRRKNNKNLNHSVEESMPKKFRSGGIKKMNTIDISPSKKQSQITKYLSPQKDLVNRPKVLQVNVQNSVTSAVLQKETSCNFLDKKPVRNLNMNNVRSNVLNKSTEEIIILESSQEDEVPPYQSLQGVHSKVNISVIKNESLTVTKIPVKTRETVLPKCISPSKRKHPVNNLPFSLKRKQSKVLEDQSHVDKSKITLVRNQTSMDKSVDASTDYKSKRNLSIVDKQQVQSVRDHVLLNKSQVTLTPVKSQVSPGNVKEFTSSSSLEIIGVSDSQHDVTTFEDTQTDFSVQQFNRRTLKEVEIKKLANTENDNLLRCNIKVKSPCQLLSNDVLIARVDKEKSPKIRANIASGEYLNSNEKSPKMKSEILMKTPQKSRRNKNTEGAQSSPTKRSTTPKKQNKSVTPKKSTPLSEIGTQGEIIKFSPKIKRRPGKYFDETSMPGELVKSPTRRNRTTPTKKNLMKEFDNSPDQKKLDSYFCKNVSGTNDISNSNSQNGLLDNDMELLQNWDDVELLINNNEAMERIRSENLKKSPAKSHSAEQNRTSTVNGNSKSFSSPSKSPKKKITNNSSHQFESFSYYLVSNPMITTAIKNNILRNDEFENMMQIFKSLSPGALDLYRKMFERTPTWYRVDDDLTQKYSDLFGDVKGHIATLLFHGIVKEDVTSIGLLELLNLLKLNELKSVCKHFNVSALKNGSNMKKEKLVTILLNHAFSQKTLFGNLTTKMKVFISKELGQCVRLSDEFRQMFNLLVVMATYPYYLDEEKKRLTDLVFKLNELKMKRISYPSYICKPDVAFRSIQQLSDYAEAVTFVSEYSTLVENKDWNNAAIKVVEAEAKFKEFLNDRRNINLLQDIGGHLRKFTAGYQYAYCLSDGITVLKKDSEFTDKCIQTIGSLLSQQYYLGRKRGIWYDELALVQMKEKDLPAACQTVINGLNDDSVDIIRKKMLSQRAATLIKRKTSAITDAVRAQLRGHMITDQYNPGHHTITAKCHEGVAGRKQVFYKECDDGKEYSSVEEIAIHHYKNFAMPSYKHGLHDEGRTIMNLILACFYDIIYCDPGGDSVFHCHMQTHPLDWGGWHFYKKREQMIQKHLQALRMGGCQEIMTVLNNLCSTAEKVNSVINWDYISTDKLSKIWELLECLSADVFVNIAEHVIKDYKLYHSGFPDLILWDPPTKRCLLVEVKGPNDRLSPTQTVWLENLNKFGANAVVCHVESEGSRKRKAT